MVKIKLDNVIYCDLTNETELREKNITAVHAFCFYGDKLVVVYSKKKNIWTPPGGGTEEGETALEAVTREIKEETNMKVLHHKFIGYQDIEEPEGVITQTRSFCIVEPYGDFIEDPDGKDITEIKLIDPEDYRHYFDWGEIGEHLVKRAIELKSTIK
jgi:ADP-ribose pyrophosphatase YjhB (NUDIX family)